MGMEVVREVVEVMTGATDRIVDRVDGGREGEDSDIKIVLVS